jgi:hypothetical protein
VEGATMTIWLKKMLASHRQRPKSTTASAAAVKESTLTTVYHASVLDFLAHQNTDLARKVFAVCAMVRFRYCVVSVKVTVAATLDHSAK